jgi:hypothetical protein
MISVQAQILTSNIDKSEIESRKSYQVYAGKLERISLPNKDWKKIKEEERKLNPTQFGHKIKVNYGVENAGRWFIMNNGDRVWVFEIYSEGASSLSFQYDDFYIPPGAELIIYNKEKTIKKGPITSSINRADKTYATGPLPGETSILEYYEPASCTEDVRLKIGHVIHDYSGLANYQSQKTGSQPNETDIKFGGSIFDTNSVASTCDNNLTCYSSWQTQAEGVCRMLTNGTLKFSACLVNNTAQDGTPYVLVADHSIGTPTGGWGGTVPNTIFQFNYQTTTCSGSILRTIVEYTGADILVRHSDTDLALLQLDDDLSLADCDITLLGWSKSSSSPTSTTVLHHGGGNPMYISFGGSGTSTQTLGIGIYVWDVTLNSGIIESNSSGGPLLDQNKRVIGSVYGSYSSDLISCSNQDGKAWFGRLEKAWNGTDFGITGGVHISAMKTYLDKNNTGATTLNALTVNNKPNYTKLDIVTTNSGGFHEIMACDYTSAIAEYDGGNGSAIGIDAYEWNMPYTSNWDIYEEYHAGIDMQYVEIEYWEYPAPGTETINLRAHNTCGWSSWKSIAVDVEDNCGWYLMFTPNPSSRETTLSIETSSSNKTTNKATESVFDESVEWDIEVYDYYKNPQLRKNSIQGKSTKIETTNWKNGIYVVRVKYMDRIIVGKLVVEN